jgi:hypothetical protein
MAERRLALAAIAEAAFEFRIGQDDAASALGKQRGRKTGGCKGREYAFHDWVTPHCGELVERAVCDLGRSFRPGQNSAYHFAN